ncbi:hypothetical protein H8356DRAFT_1691571 [Neocallimastix lanati (nom. inval.)]|nr:hypothetical protein H8356DRAFT_1691571 [Neocallimastix sp. JGI-2020a]
MRFNKRFPFFFFFLSINNYTFIIITSKKMNFFTLITIFIYINIYKIRIEYNTFFFFLIIYIIIFNFFEICNFYF